MKKKTNRKILRRILKRTIQGNSSLEETTFLKKWEDFYQSKKALNESFVGAEKEKIGQEIWSNINQKRTRLGGRFIRKKAVFLRYASIFLLVAGTGIVLFRYSNDQIENTSSTRVVLPLNDVLPGGNQAVLYLGTGEIIELSEAHNHIQVGEQIRYADGSKIQSLSNPSEKQNLTLEIPKAGMYQITLSDGTHVWLNSASKLTYPKKFANEHRTVELVGEAYFEVNSSTTPFFVKTAFQTIQVLGTSFTISAYPDEQETWTTLNSGVVEVRNLQTHSSLILSPGEQSKVLGDQLIKRKVHVREYTAWKDGLFIFNDTPLRAILKQLQRWYDFEIEATEIPDLHFNGGIRRDEPLSKVLDMLTSTSDKIEFKIKDRKLFIKLKLQKKHEIK